MVQSNTANGGTTYANLEIQLVNDNGLQQVLRAALYLTSLNVTDSTNDLSVSGNWSRSGALALGGVYSNTVVWYQDITVARALGSNQTVNVSFSWSSVNYWGTTLSASTSHVVPARYEAPSAPPTSHDSVTPTSARTIFGAPTYGGGTGIYLVEGYVLTNNAWPDSGGNVIASASWPGGAGGTITPTNLLPSGTYYYTGRSHNNASLWSAWAPMKVFTTLPAGYVKLAGVWRNAIPYVKVAGIWKMATPYVKVAGVWKLA